MKFLLLAADSRFLAAARAGLVLARITRVGVGGRCGGLRARFACSGTKAASIVGSGQGGGKFVVLEMVVSGDIIAMGLALSLAMGLFGGLIPSIRAMLVRSLESLR